MACQLRSSWTYSVAEPVDETVEEEVVAPIKRQG
jgi:hypothetical protein